MREVWLRPRPVSGPDNTMFHYFRDCHLVSRIAEAFIRRMTAEAAIDEGRLLCTFCHRRRVRDGG